MRRPRQVVFRGADLARAWALYDFEARCLAALLACEGQAEHREHHLNRAVALARGSWGYSVRKP